MTSFLKGQNRPITVCHGSSRPGMLGSWDFMVLSSDNDTGIVYTFQVPQSVIRQRLQITRSIETYAYPEIISICDLCVVMDRQGMTVSCTYAIQYVNCLGVWKTNVYCSNHLLRRWLGWVNLGVLTTF